MKQDVVKQRAPRRRVLKSGVIQAHPVGIVCTVKNISESGALLLADADENIEEFILVLCLRSW